MIQSRSEKIYQIVAHIILMLMVFCIAMPFILLFMSSITDENTLIQNGYSYFPAKFSLTAYKYIWNQKAKVFQAYGMTILVTVVGTAINIAISAMLAYGLSKAKLPLRRFFAFYVFFTMLFNGGLVPTYMMYTGTFHIKNTVFALIVPAFMMSAMNVILIRTYYQTSIPDALYEAAEIDGAGPFKVFTTIALPLGKPILVTMGLFAALGYWNDWTNGLYYLSGTEGQKLYTIQNLLNQMMSQIEFLSSNSSAASAASSDIAKVPQTAVRMAIAFVAMLPMLVIYPFLQKYFQKGIALGAVKG
ncbi:MAG: carbohydrate ABC transporter permease [Roseburia sp.]|jgi:putative aldouronate transport system permease protein|nr:carbohydrate ABC transporter permease [Roseburia sp.]